jgi:hypothetical protein
MHVGGSSRIRATSAGRTGRDVAQFSSSRTALRPNDEDLTTPGCRTGVLPRSERAALAFNNGERYRVAMTTFSDKSHVVRLEGGGLDEVRQIVALPVWPADATHAERMELLLDESALRDFLVRWAYAFDARDVDGLMEFFTDDCTLVNSRGRFEGRAEIRNNYEMYYQRWGRLVHWWTNVTVRFPDRVDEAYLAAYHYGMNVSSDGNRKVGDVGTDIWRVNKFDNGWKGVERFLTFDIDYDFTGWNETPVT